MSDSVVPVWAWSSAFAILLCVMFLQTCSEHEHEYKRSPEYAERIKKCETPVMVSQTPDGLQLWSSRPKCDDPVYFSRSGTQWTTQEMEGKVSVPVKHAVPASSPLPTPPKDQ